MLKLTLGLFCLLLFDPGIIWAQAARRSPTDFRFRYYSGDRVDGKYTSSWNAQHFSWKGWGFGTSRVTVSDEVNSYQNDITLDYQDLSYTFGQRFTLMLGVGQPTDSSSAKTTSTSTNNTWTAKTRAGSTSYFAVIGLEVFGFLEVLVGSRMTQYKFNDFERVASGITDRLHSSLEGGVYQIMTGVGIVF